MPANKDLIDGWLKNRRPKVRPPGGKSIDEINEEVNQEIDNKTADSMNTTLKGVVYLKGKLRLDAAKLMLQAQIKKADLPEGLLPDLTGQSVD